MSYHKNNKLTSNCIIELEKPAQVDDVERIGIQKVREVPEYHDEPLRGDRSGQRSIRLNRSYRAIYIERPNKEITIISIMEVNKHDY